MYLVNESSKHEPVKRVYKTREKSQSLLDHPRIPPYFSDVLTPRISKGFINIHKNKYQMTYILRGN